MSLYALYRLLWRPALLAVYMLFAGIILLVLWAAGTKLDSLSEPGRLILLTMALPSIAGFFVGQSVGEIQYTPLSWSLPRIRRAARLLGMLDRSRRIRPDNLGLRLVGRLCPDNSDSCLVFPMVQFGIYDRYL